MFPEELEGSPGPREQPRRETVRVTPGSEGLRRTLRSGVSEGPGNGNDPLNCASPRAPATPLDGGTLSVACDSPSAQGAARRLRETVQEAAWGPRLASGLFRCSLQFTNGFYTVEMGHTSLHNRPNVPLGPQSLKYLLPGYYEKRLLNTMPGYEEEEDRPSVPVRECSSVVQGQRHSADLTQRRLPGCRPTRKTLP